MRLPWAMPGIASSIVPGIKIKLALPDNSERPQEYAFVLTTLKQDSLRPEEVEQKRESPEKDAF